mgnify:FL=1
MFESIQMYLNASKSRYSNVFEIFKCIQNIPEILYSGGFPFEKSFEF